MLQRPAAKFEREPKMYFIYTIVNVCNNKVYVGMSNSTSAYYNPLKYFIAQNTENGTYMALYNSIEEYGIHKHIVTRVEREGCYGIDIETAEKIKYRFTKFYSELDRSLNDSNEEPERYSCICGWRILKSKRDAHCCKMEIKNKIMGELDHVL